MKNILSATAYIFALTLFSVAVVAYFLQLQPKPQPKENIVTPGDTIKLSTKIIQAAMPVIIELESKGDSCALGKTNDLGLLQITPICVKDYNIHSGDSLKWSQMTSPELSKRVYNFQMQRQYELFTKKNGYEPTEAQVVAFWNGRKYNQNYVNRYFEIKGRN